MLHKANSSVFISLLDMGTFCQHSLPLAWKWKLVLSCVSVLFANSWTAAHQAPLSMGFSRQEYWSGLPFPSPGDLPYPGIEPGSPALQADSLLPESPGKSQVSVLKTDTPRGKFTCPIYMQISRVWLGPNSISSTTFTVNLVLIIQLNPYMPGTMSALHALCHLMLKTTWRVLLLSFPFYRWWHQALERLDKWTRSHNQQRQTQIMLLKTTHRQLLCQVLGIQSWMRLSLPWRCCQLSRRNRSALQLSS